MIFIYIIHHNLALCKIFFIKSMAEVLHILQILRNNSIVKRKDFHYQAICQTITAIMQIPSATAMAEEKQNYSNFDASYVMSY